MPTTVPGYRIGVIPAYGRDYKSQKAVQEAWDANLDFEVTDLQHAGAKINKEDAVRYGYSVTVRYNKLTRQVCVK